MGKRRRNERQVLACAIGIDKVRYCTAHDEEVKTYKVWPKKTIRYQCTEGCKISKTETVLKQKKPTKSRWK